MGYQEPGPLRLWKNANKFFFNGKVYPLFTHNMNCGWPPFRMTERSVELSIADDWINDHDEIIEIGAVTPYYWPGRIKDIVDPTDKHSLVNLRKCLFEVDVFGKNVLSISTIEHVGQAEYGLEKETCLAISAIEKLTTQAIDFLITIPVGWNKHLDAYLFDENKNKNFRQYFLSRGHGCIDNKWIQHDSLSEPQRVYGNIGNDVSIFGRSANSVAIIMS